MRRIPEDSLNDHARLLNAHSRMAEQPARHRRGHDARRQLCYRSELEPFTPEYAFRNMTFINTLFADISGRRRSSPRAFWKHKYGEYA